MGVKASYDFLACGDFDPLQTGWELGPIRGSPFMNQIALGYHSSPDFIKEVPDLDSFNKNDVTQPMACLARVA
jgi:hypothetical protein